MTDAETAPTGRATSPDGSISVTCTAADPVHELYIHPVATRWSVYDLAYVVQETVREAEHDLDEQLAAQRDADDEQVPDVEATMAEMRTLSELSRAGGDAAVMAEMRRRLGIQ